MTLSSLNKTNNTSVSLPLDSAPIGSIQDFSGVSVPIGYLPCDGSAVSRTVYASLFAQTGTMYGSGDGITTFNLPKAYGNGYPNFVPVYIGQEYIDISTGSIYISVGNSGIYNWGYVGSGSTVNDYRVNLTSWYDASDSITPAINGSTLTAWNDKGSQANNLTSVSAGTPKYYTNIQNGLPAVYFDGGATIEGTNKADTGQPQTHFLVFKPTSWGTGAAQVMVDMYAATELIGKVNGSTATYIYSASTALTGPSISSNNPYLISAVFNGGSSSLIINNGSTTSGSVGTTSNSNMPVIGGESSISNRYIGYVMEWRVYDGVLTTDQQTVVRNYLNNKWLIY